jgi:glycosyltransferase involved in cell wall biosynthesis
MNARIIDTFSKNGTHEIFNSALLSMCSSIFDSTEYLCSSSTEDSVKNMLRNHEKQQYFENVTFRNIRIRQFGKFDKLIKERARLLQDLFHLVTAKKNAFIIYSGGSYAFLLWWINIFNFFFRHNVWIFCHGEIEKLLLKSDKYKFYNIGIFYKQTLYQWFLKYGQINKRVSYYVLGNSILTNLQPYLSKHNKKHFISINHPILFKKQQAKNHSNNSLKIGTVGSMNEEKGLLKLLDIAKQLKDEIILSVIGSVSDKIDYEKYPYINFISKDNKIPIPREKFDKEIASLDYILFLYDTHSYKFIASGAIFDAMIMEKPIISLHNDFFDETLKLPIGYLLNTTNEIIEQIHKLNRNHPDNPDYDVFLKNIGILKEYHQTDNVRQTWENKIVK